MIDASGRALGFLSLGLFGFGVDFTVSVITRTRKQQNAC